MNLKKIIYNIIKYPLILIFLKTPLINILINRFKFHRSRKTKNIVMFILDTLFQKEYFNKLKSKEKIRELTDSTLISGEGRKWAQYYYDKHFQTLDQLKKKKLSLMSYDEATLIWTRIINHININNLEKNKDVYIIQLGSSSGRGLQFFYNIYPDLNYISTDVNDEILDFQREKYNYPNFKYFKCYAEDIDKCINHFNLKDKIIILFASGSIQYVNPYFLKEFFNKITIYKKLNLFINEPISLNFIDKSKKLSENRGNISFSHRYDEYAKTVKIKILEKKINRPYAKDNPNHKDTGLYYLHVKS